MSADEWEVAADIFTSPKFTGYSQPYSRGTYRGLREQRSIWEALFLSGTKHE